jgi:hypothetical protein
MSSDDRVRPADSTLDERLRAAGNGLREASNAQVDAATGLREILHGARAVTGDQAPPLADQPPGLDAPDAPLPGPPSRRLLRASRLALVVNLLLVVALSVVLVRVASFRRDPVSAAPVATATTVVQQAKVPATTPPASSVPAKIQVPEACIDTTELADEVIARLNRNQRDNALALALRDYTIASQACRREASR